MHQKQNGPAVGVASQAGPNESVKSGQRFEYVSNARAIAVQEADVDDGRFGEAASDDEPLSRQLMLALNYAGRHGFPVFPVCPHTKRPLTPHGFKDATRDTVKIWSWWEASPDALVGIPTGTATGFWVFDVDGQEGRESLRALLAQLGWSSDPEMMFLSNLVVATPSGGLHFYFKLCPGDRPRSRASDIAPCLDTRGEGGYIIAAGNVRPDGKSYDAIMSGNGEFPGVQGLGFAPLELVYMATFNKSERDLIAATLALAEAVRDAEPAEWASILEEHRKAEHKQALEQMRRYPPDGDAMRRQALGDLTDAASEFGNLSDNRRNGLFSIVCRLAKYVANEVLSEAEVRAALESAAAANGSIRDHGQRWLETTIRNAVARGRNDPLPALARRFRRAAA